MDRLKMMIDKLSDRWIVLSLQEQVSAAVQSLLQTKHLYQSVTVDLSPLNKAIDEYRPDPSSIPLSGPPIDIAQRDRDHFRTILRGLLGLPWYLQYQLPREQALPGPTELRQQGYWPMAMPDIRIFCANKGCGGLQPHNGGYRGQMQDLSDAVLRAGAVLPAAPLQVMFLPYQCQACKKEPVIFMVRREATKLTMVGRSHFEEVACPDCLSGEEAKYYSDAIIAFNCGRVLAGLFYLRVLVERYWRSVLSVPPDERIDADELSERYSELLPSDFPRSRFKSLGKVYDELSACIHAADENEEQFSASTKDIVNHFEALKLCPLDPPSPSDDTAGPSS